MPLRFVIAPIGAGKTTAVVTYLAGRATKAIYCALAADDTLDAFRSRLARALELGDEPASADALLAALATVAPCEIVLDDVERAPIETIDEIADLVAGTPSGVRFVIVTRSRGAIEVSRYVARGFAAILEMQALAFDAGDVARLCDVRRLAYTPTDIARFLEETDGWPLVASWALRDCASGSTLAGAFDRWRRANARHVRDFVDNELRAAGDAYREAFRRTLQGAASPHEREDLALLEARGLFVGYADGVMRPYRVARQIDTVALHAVTEPVEAALLVVRLFGRFDATIGGRKIEWIRKREAQIFKYLVLKRNGTASRDELLATFWPGSHGRAATQSLRTASSNIRKALAAIVGYGDVERYFSSRGELAVTLERAVIDVRRFSAHVADGDLERERGHLAEAFAHYRAAESMYGGDLLRGEYPEPWYAARAAMYDALYASVLERIAEYHADAGHLGHAREYGTRVAKLRARELSASASGADA